MLHMAMICGKLKIELKMHIQCFEKPSSINFEWGISGTLQCLTEELGIHLSDQKPLLKCYPIPQTYT